VVSVPPIVAFTATETTILKMLCAGHCAKEIAAALNIEVSTVARRHRYNIYRKVARQLGKPQGYLTQTRLLIWALHHGVVSFQELSLRHWKTRGLSPLSSVKSAI